MERDRESKLNPEDFDSSYPDATVMLIHSGDKVDGGTKFRNQLL